MRVEAAVWKFGSWIAAIRLVSLWSMVVGLRYGDWRQNLGIFFRSSLRQSLFLQGESLTLIINGWTKMAG